MRGICRAILASVFTLSASVAGVAGAGPLIAEASGNWAGPAGGGFWFTATLEQDGDSARLRIWNGMEPSPMAGDPQLDVPDFALSAFVTEGGQRLEVIDSPEGTILQVVTEFADEEAEGRDVVQLRFIDNQFTVTGYYHLSRFYNPGGVPEVIECDVDLTRGRLTVDGTESRLPDLPFEDLNASLWHYGAGFDRGWCPRFG